MKNKILAIMIVLAFLSVGVIMGYSLYTQKHVVRYERQLNEYLTEIKFYDGKLGVKNNITGSIVGRYDKIIPYYGRSNVSTFIVVKDDLRGYISAATGEVIFDPQFLYAWINDTASNLAACVNQDYKLGFVNVKTKKVAIPFQYDFDEDVLVPYDYLDRRFPVLDFVFSNGFCIVPGNEGKIGLIDETGKLVLPIQYTDIINWRDMNTPEIILKRPVFFGGIGIMYSYEDGQMRITDILPGLPADKQGALKKDDIILQIKPSDAAKYVDVTRPDFVNPRELILGDVGTKVSLLVKHNNGLTENITLIREEIKFYDNENKYLYGVCDRNFNMFVPFKFNTMEKVWRYDFYNDKVQMFGYIVSQNGKYGLLDTSFKERLPLKYDHIEVVLNNGGYIVSCGGKYGVLDSAFQIILPLEYESIYEVYLHNHENEYGFAAVKNYIPKLFSETGSLLNDFYVRHYDVYDIELGEYVEKIGLEPLPEPFQKCASQYLQYYLEGYYGVIDVSRRLVIPAKYDKIEYLGYGNFVCTLEDNSYFLHDNK